MTTLESLTMRGFAGRSGFGKSPALVVVDFCKAFTVPEHQLGSDSLLEITETNHLTDSFRKHGLPVFYMIICYETQAEAEATNWRSKIDGVSTLHKGSWGVELDDRLNRLPDDPVISKKYASSFFATDLDARLTALGIDTVVITGTSTSGCVRATAVDACQYGYKAVVCREAVADRDRQAHNQALVDIELKYGDVLSRAEIERLLNSKS
ncbi:isochorismatase family protein [Brucella sp. BE17]|uniref:isochorismatase family protein n=1 Tax=Brucella sp. BE17 TaxID=3142977 RepID=UPI0031BA904F